MIKPGEIQKKATIARVRDTQIEKDYILTWVLYGFASVPELTNTLAFKGGTVLKKAYFEDYRFSEDLDFSIVKHDVSNEQLLAWIEQSFEVVSEHSNIRLQIVDSGEHISGSLHFQIAYQGPLGGKGKQVKVDITRGEQFEFPMVLLPIFGGYSDVQAFQLQCYPLEEVLIEKLCATMGRMQPRDLYDLWYLTEHHGLDPAFHMPEFQRKAQHKGYDDALVSSKPKTFLKTITTYDIRFTGSFSTTTRQTSCNWVSVAVLCWVDSRGLASARLMLSRPPYAPPQRWWSRPRRVEFCEPLSPCATSTQ